MSSSSSFVLLLAVIIFATAAASPCLAETADFAASARSKLVANDIAMQQDFILDRCDHACNLEPKVARECRKRMLPYATAVNCSFVKASFNAATVMVSDLTAFTRELHELDRAHPEYKLGGCIKMVEEAMAGAKEPLAQLKRLGDEVGDEKMGGSDLEGPAGWVDSVYRNFQVQCTDGGLKNIKRLARKMPTASLLNNSISFSTAFVNGPTPYAGNFLESPMR